MLVIKKRPTAGGEPPFYIASLIAPAGQAFLRRVGNLLVPRDSPSGAAAIPPLNFKANQLGRSAKDENRPPLRTRFHFEN